MGHALKNVQNSLEKNKFLNFNISGCLLMTSHIDFEIDKTLPDGTRHVY